MPDQKHNWWQGVSWVGYQIAIFTLSFYPQEMVHSKVILWCTVGSILSIAFFNCSGIMVTKQLSGTSRATIDACRTAMVWAFSLYVGWENFHLLQVALLPWMWCLDGLIRSSARRDRKMSAWQVKEPYRHQSLEQHSSSVTKMEGIWWSFSRLLEQKFRLVSILD